MCTRLEVSVEDYDVLCLYIYILDPVSVRVGPQDGVTSGTSVVLKHERGPGLGIGGSSASPTAPSSTFPVVRGSVAPDPASVVSWSARVPLFEPATPLKPGVNRGVIL